MKKIIILASIVMASAPVFAGILEGGYKGVSCKLTGSEKVYSPKTGGKNTTDIAFSLNNKSGGAIYFKVNNGGAITRFGQSLTKGADLLTKNAVAESKLDISNKTILTIYDNKGTELIEAEFPKNKTIYINWDGTNLYKQKGPLMGLTGVNDNCYSLKNNVADNEIKIKRFKK